LIAPNAPNTLVSVGRQADYGRPSLLTKYGAWHLPLDAISRLVADPRAVKVATRDASTNGMYEVIPDALGLLTRAELFKIIPDYRRVMLFVELFGLGSLTEAVRMYGIQCPDPADIKTTGEDLSKMCNIQQIHKMLEWFGVAVLHSANPCTAFACPQRMNQAKWPAGKLEAMQAPYIAMLEKLLPLYVTHCRGQNGIPGFMVMEGPGKGLMWKIHVIQKLIALCGLNRPVCYGTGDLVDDDIIPSSCIFIDLSVCGCCCWFFDDALIGKKSPEETRLLLRPQRRGLAAALPTPTLRVNEAAEL
jgi:hypothetical protein